MSRLPTMTLFTFGALVLVAAALLTPGCSPRSRHRWLGDPAYDPKQNVNSVPIIRKEEWGRERWDSGPLDPPMNRRLSDVPDEIVNRGWELLAEKVSPEFCEAYLVLNSELSGTEQPGDLRAPPEHHLVFELESPQKPFIHGRVDLFLDVLGHSILGSRINGLPDCDGDFATCDITVDKSQALAIAEADGFLEGTEHRSSAFMWDAALRRYVWQISGTSDLSANKIWVLEVTVDAHSGEIRGRGRWIGDRGAATVDSIAP